MMTRPLICLTLASVLLSGPVCLADDHGNVTKPARQLLRHVVLFKWKDGTPAEEIKAIEEAFCALPGKVDAIYDFEWGANVSPQGKNQGFTHCFLVSFLSEAGRGAYLPHPAHRAFVDLITPHLDKVLVLDYWAKESPDFQADRKVLRHVVLFQWKDAATARDVMVIENAFCSLPSKIDAIHDLEWGTDTSAEGLAQGFTHCFLVSFLTEQDRGTYLPHPAHEAFRNVIGPHLEQVLVLDYWVQR